MQAVLGALQALGVFVACLAIIFIGVAGLCWLLERIDATVEDYFK
jgi:uncharacterized membrane protein